MLSFYKGSKNAQIEMIWAFFFCAYFAAVHFALKNAYCLTAYYLLLTTTYCLPLLALKDQVK
jgi:hypothetical protein